MSYDIIIAGDIIFLYTVIGEGIMNAHRYHYCSFISNKTILLYLNI